ncbi:MAG: peptide deformylase [Gammaproteobacteria bacterium]|nr:peptide deformylase [Gammaproteobacteria bacterium]
MRNLLEKNAPTLRLVAELVPREEMQSDWLRTLVRDMLDIMEEKGAVGVAAPQIGVSKRVIVFGTAYARRRKPEVDIPDTVLINPSFTVLSEIEETGYEGCLNCGDLMGPVPRAQEIEYSGYNMSGELVTKHATGLEARILQHEVDHLNGFLGVV